MFRRLDVPARSLRAGCRVGGRVHRPRQIAKLGERRGPPPAAAVVAPPAVAEAASSGAGDGCTVITTGKAATVDGSVITSHSDTCSECRLRVVPGRTFPAGAMADNVPRPA